MSTEESMVLKRRVLAIAQNITGVQNAAWVNNLPLPGTSTSGLFVPGIDSVAKLGRFTYQTASTDYFNVIGTKIIRGRAFGAGDRVGAPGAIVVSVSMARTLWPEKNPIGQCVRISADTVPCSYVVGVAEDAVHDPVKDQPLRYYLPSEQFPREGGSMLVLRVSNRPSAMMESVRRTLQKEMPGKQYVTVAEMSELLNAQRHSWMVGATMFVACGVLALVVAAVGLYGVIAYNVAQRMHELGVRIALGARGHNVLQLVLAEGLRLALFGVAIGSVLAIGAARWIQPLLFQQSARDPLVFGAVTTLLVTVSPLASAVPAARAMRADPNAVLRSD